MKNRTAGDLTLIALLIAIVFVTTYLVQIPMCVARYQTYDRLPAERT